ncbi:MAG: SUMF1/EgtB/PvdO family nonheme iron enzyme [Alphaproteobacteria bacterium]|nr:SUMF1/EgtB/PvdO family nonheme iron enzyme [Alphaproteobacteria bacterium]
MIWLVLAACKGTDVDDTGETGVTEDCAVEMAGSGLPVGPADCADGVCEVPAGPFWQGAPSPARPAECPARQVTLSAFAIDQDEVTVGRWQACVDAGSCAALPETCYFGFEGPLDGLPAVCVTWTQAADFCAWAGGRLPTEAEWEKAARGTEGAAFPWGSRVPLCADANYRTAVAYCAYSVIDVGSFPDSVTAYGLRDTVGNAWEWVADHWDAGYYRDAPDADPPGPAEGCRETVDDAPGECVFRGMRGGAYNTTVENVKGAGRSFNSPETWDVNLGLRCAYDR